MLKYRLISFPLLLAVVAVIFAWPNFGQWLYLVLAPVAVGLAVFEAAQMVNAKITPCFPTVAGGAVGILLFAFLLNNLVNSNWKFGPLLLALVALMLPMAWLLITRNLEQVKKLLGTTGVILMLGVPLFLTALVYFVSFPLNFSENIFSMKSDQVSALLFLLLVTKATDTGGYIFGQLSNKYLPGGNHKIAPTVSPKKSWEGLAGGMMLSILVALIFFWCGTPMEWTWAVVAGIVLSLGSFFGDLTESALKRLAEIKDSGNYIPGMGGALDVLDSFIYNGVIFWILFGIEF